MTRRSYRSAIFGPGLILAVGASVILAGGPAQAASNTVTGSRAGHVTQAITLNDLKPAVCVTGVPTQLVIGSGVFNGTNQPDLILGSTAVDSIDGRNGNDCIVGGDGDDTIDGRNGNDVCIGGPGNDTFFRCETAIQ